jgi:hypothetical protein
VGVQRSDAETLRQLEEQLLQPHVRRSAAALGRLLADEFLEFGSSGRTWNKEQIIESLQQEDGGCRRSLRDFQMKLLAPGVVLAMYRVSRKSDGDAQPVESRRSSIWKMIDGRWQMVFHQGTICRDSP